MDIKLMIIDNLDFDKIMFDGTAYILEEEEEESLTTALMKNNFDNTIDKIINLYEKEEMYSTVNSINDEINTYLKSKENVKKTIILLPDTGLRGTDKINLTLNSLLYFKISNELGLGFFVNKLLSSILTKELNYVNKA